MKGHVRCTTPNKAKERQNILIAGSDQDPKGDSPILPSGRGSSFPRIFLPLPLESLVISAVPVLFGCCSRGIVRSTFLMYTAVQVDYPPTHSSTCTRPTAAETLHNLTCANHKLVHEKYHSPKSGLTGWRLPPPVPHSAVRLAANGNRCTTHCHWASLWRPPTFLPV